MNERSYVRELRHDVRYRVRFTVEKGEVQEFVVQLECFLRDAWRPVIRFDTAHGFAHRDRYLPDGSVAQHESLPVSDFGAALDYAVKTVKRDWVELSGQFLGVSS